MAQIPMRIDMSTHIWFYEQHRLLWTWIAELTHNDIVRIIAKHPDFTPDYAIKRAWPGWGDRWGLTYGSFACEVSGNNRTRCFKCPLGTDFCQRTDSGYQKFLSSIRAGDITAFKAAALEVRDAWKKPVTQEKSNWW